MAITQSSEVGDARAALNHLLQVTSRAESLIDSHEFTLRLRRCAQVRLSTRRKTPPSESAILQATIGCALIDALLTGHPEEAIAQPLREAKRALDSVLRPADGHD